ncbi:3-isopropylmalate dehydratase small subunit [Thalassococcus sp. S3]|uniref:3-isopropylmalate dehydratase small subunit n=1 Tax=Thalassococcus sp. S3 TaxID=2017482 RepID=UPI001023FE58|nr:3-isopropylmalate dehydratase small subunit [Thalassococcus sp. S3]QBF33960.1 3-isopropylmalate dehydratase small subunit [Thalassococcus sp. S3]
MEAFRQHQGLAAVMAVDNVNTDQIIPSREMKRVSKKGLADGLFANLRYLDADTGGRTPDPDFLLNQPEAQGATILIGGVNLGCGSSREHAVWALREYGFRALIAASFGSIFRDNCVANGVVPVTLDKAEVAALAEAAAAHHVTVDLDAMQVRCGDLSFDFKLSDERREMLREGLSPVDVTLKHQSEIDAFRARDRITRAWLYQFGEGQG